MEFFGKTQLQIQAHATWKGTLMKHW